MGEIFRHVFRIFAILALAMAFTAALLLSRPIAVAAAAAAHVRLVTAAGTQVFLTTAGDVGAFLEEQGIELGPADVIQPTLADPIADGQTIRIIRIRHWNSAQSFRMTPRIVHEIDFSLPPGATKIVAKGEPGLRETIVAYTQTDGQIRKHLVASRVLRMPRARVIAEGVGTYAAFADFAQRGMQKSSLIASRAMDMLATAYTASCSGCSGYTATGYHAGRGIVAVDPRVIPLGTKLYIPGYGFAIAGDTGGDIVGDRIDLGFDSWSDAMSFGRRVIRVYTLP